MEDNLAGIFTIILPIPIAILIFGFTWAQVPNKIRYLIPEGWDAALLVPVIIATTMLGLALADGVEGLLFGGDMRLWLTSELDIPFDQRNALVVGVAMGFAVIPTIFSITEDAIFAVPKHLSYGSLALGATPWQTLTRVVLPTASPGIFSALMIGMGRAVGETMIVLMATGNTPIMDVNIFEGMRTLAANIAVEMPESEVGSTHYRILFLAAFVLFMFTFAVNTLAELVRQRLRKKYGSL
jgi:phosphate transport system permease protein